MRPKSHSWDQDTYVFFHRLEDKWLEFVQAMIYPRPPPLLHNWFITLQTRITVLLTTLLVGTPLKLRLPRFNRTRALNRCSQTNISPCVNQTPPDALSSQWPLKKWDMWCEDLYVGIITALLGTAEVTIQAPRAFAGRRTGSDGKKSVRATSLGSCQPAVTFYWNVWFSYEQGLS